MSVLVSISRLLESQYYFLCDNYQISISIIFSVTTDVSVFFFFTATEVPALFSLSLLLKYQHYLAVTTTEVPALISLSQLLKYQHDLSVTATEL